MANFKEIEKRQKDFERDLEVLTDLMEQGDLFEFEAKALGAFGATLILVSEKIKDRKSNDPEDIKKVAPIMFGVAGRLARLSNLVSEYRNRMDGDS